MTVPSARRAPVASQPRTVTEQNNNGLAPRPTVTELNNAGVKSKRALLPMASMSFPFPFAQSAANMPTNSWVPFPWQFPPNFGPGFYGHFLGQQSTPQQ